MAQNKQPNRKSSRSFDMEKKPKRSFDLEKEEAVAASPAPNAPKAEPKQEQPQQKPIQPKPQPITPQASIEEPEEKKGGKGILWLIIALIVIAIIAFFGLKGCGDDKETTVGTATEETAQETAPTVSDNIATETTEEVSDETATETTSNEDVMPENANSSNESAATATPSETAPAVNNQGDTISPSSTAASTAAPKAAPNVTGNLSQDEIEKVAYEVISGKYGVGLDRKNALGANYSAIQHRVNQLKEQGVF